MKKTAKLGILHPVSSLHALSHHASGMQDSVAVSGIFIQKSRGLTAQMSFFFLL